MSRLYLVLIAFAVGACMPSLDAEGSLAEHAAAFNVLRAQKGHFSGGSWNDAVDRFDGRKHQVMMKLGAMLGDGRHNRADVVALLGEPDAVLHRSDMMFRESYEGRDPDVRELLVYHWRGWHDFLYFASDGVLVRSAGWWMALE